MCYHHINGQVKHSYQYGVPMNDFLLAIVAVICADTPKSAIKKTKVKTELQLTSDLMWLIVKEHKFGFPVVKRLLNILEIFNKK